jgi:hypothetical protein
MIATRQRKQKKGSLLPVLLPFAAIVMLIVALTWPPSRNFIANGPLHPVVDTLDNVWATVSRPLTFAYQQQQITDRNVQVKQLNDKLEADRKAADEKDAQIASLQKQLTANAGEPTAAPSPGAPGSAAAAGASGATGGAASAPGLPGRRSSGPRWIRSERPPSRKNCRPSTIRPCSLRCRPTMSARSWTRSPRPLPPRSCKAVRKLRFRPKPADRVVKPALRAFLPFAGLPQHERR